MTTAVPVEGGMKKKERTGPLTNHLKESESSEEYTAGPCRGQHPWTGAPPTGGGVVGAGKCRRHADGRETVTFGPAFLSPPLSHSTLDDVLSLATQSVRLFSLSFFYTR